MQPKPHRFRRLLPLVITLMVAVFAFAQYQFIYDWLNLRNYHAPANVSTLADVTTMTPKARHDFYVNHPQVQGKDSFNQRCPDNGGEQTIVLGCYIPRQHGIFVFEVTEPQLNGVEEVTAAHEMLHSAYDRLSNKDRTYIDGLLQNYYDHDMHDKRLTEVFAAYQKSEPGDLVNEMHSIFGTEVANLPPALEDYYKQYFTNRHAVTDFAAKYQAAFTSRQDQITSYDDQLKKLKSEIEANQASIDTQSNNISARRQQLTNLLASGNSNAYNDQVDGFNSMVNQYNALVSQTRAKINQYNDLVKKRNDIAVETQALAQELNSHLQTQNAQ